MKQIDVETVEQIARRCWREMSDTENPPWEMFESEAIEELARRVVAAWCDQGPVPVAVIDDDTESQVRLLPSIGVKNGTKLYTRPAPPQSCTEAEYIGRIAELERELQAVKADKRKVPEGWKLVPEAATLDMVSRAQMFINWDDEDVLGNLHNQWNVMLAAAPEAPAGHNTARAVAEPCDHEWALRDDSFDHEYGTEQVFYLECALCGETREPMAGDFGEAEFYDE